MQAFRASTSLARAGLEKLRCCGAVTDAGRVPKPVEIPDIIARLRADPRSFLDDLPLPVILDEIRQNVLEILSGGPLHSGLTRLRKPYGLWILTGPQERPLRAASLSVCRPRRCSSPLPFDGRID
ncbi:MAG: hypothetical protein U0793_24765 [Gemmataceae bacterium]